MATARAPDPGVPQHDITSSIVHSGTGRRVLIKREERNLYSADDGATWWERQDVAVALLSRSNIEVESGEVMRQLSELPPKHRRQIIVDGLREFANEVARGSRVAVDASGGAQDPVDHMLFCLADALRTLLARPESAEDGGAQVALGGRPSDSTTWRERLGKPQ